MQQDIMNGEPEWQIPEYQIQFWRGKKEKYCVVIPVINEGERIHSLLVKMQLCNIADIADIIIIDGGTTDGSLCEHLLKQYDVNGLLLKTDKGKLSAQLRCAYAFALKQGYDGIVTIDGNDKDDPNTIPQFINALKNGVAFVQGSRFIAGGIAENTPIVRDIAIRIIHAPVLSFGSGFKWTDTTQGFRAYSKEMLMDPEVSPFRSIFDTYELLAYLSYRVPKLGYRCVELPTKRSYPKGDVPTKISTFSGNLSLLIILFKTVLGRYNPLKRGDDFRGFH